ncbi:hypothetical protein TNCT_91431 [Trichonephila clavata]|uniref:Uncharacterized protein n=1 Tax=Trichonephila clavata TaxID=2740835 RepID=A0A8X6LKK6_TRICU|nr:hypothetical protein TNCT_91431 [Trichonephila clavata]
MVRSKGSRFLIQMKDYMILIEMGQGEASVPPTGMKDRSGRARNQISGSGFTVESAGSIIGTLDQMDKVNLTGSDQSMDLTCCAPASMESDLRKE